MSKNIFKQIFLFVFAHPDDESFYSGGLVSKIVNEGGQAHLLTLTKGEKGAKKLEHKNPQRLGKIRERELLRAGAILGFNSITILNHRDGLIKKNSLGEIANSILTEIKNIKPNVLVTFGDEPFYNHKDHLSTEEAVQLAWDISIKTLRLDLWKTAQHEQQLKNLYDLRKNKRKETIGSRENKKSLLNYQKHNLVVKLKKSDRETKARALLEHKSQEPENLVNFVINKSEEYYYAVNIQTHIKQ